MASDQSQALSKKVSIFRRFSRRDRGDTPPSPFLMNQGIRPPVQRAPRRLQRNRSYAPAPVGLLTPPPSPPEKSSFDSSESSTRYRQPARNHLTTPPHSPGSRERVVPNALLTKPFPGNPQITSWNIFLPPSQIYSLYLGHAPQEMEDKWFIYSEGPDQAGKLKVHFHRSWTGTKVAELFVVMDTKGEGAGKIVGIKWNGGEDMNWMSEEEAKYMIRTACRWQLNVHLED
ncbi:hypothetical protein J3E72DRAFT_437162 [Bipolaris maydis]|nr:hypothetical protein BM1_02672 [Bipolaris maydis]KAJ5030375.1 hypothetical protein J3E73DRAFT_378421 [Bipolaris maydis]KAJ6200596.1 hypothetical protein J3E72DRAFT_437162 [Bipolaris maydis]KAJ6285935.1 hypothetical protein J3E71DRAFT_23154 [Bipolaris maydis]